MSILSLWSELSQCPKNNVDLGEKYVVYWVLPQCVVYWVLPQCAVYLVLPQCVVYWVSPQSIFN